MSEPILPGLPGSQPGFAMPMMRGFPCPVDMPMMGANDGPQNGLGVGWSHVHGHGVKFFVSIHAGDGMALVAHLDYPRYKRLAELLASAGQQAMLVPGVEDRGPNDALAALGVAYDALKLVKDGSPDVSGTALIFDNLDAVSASVGEALSTVGAALGIIEGKPEGGAA